MTGRIGEDRKSLWQRIKRFALTDVGALVRGLNADAAIARIARARHGRDLSGFGVDTTHEVVLHLDEEHIPVLIEADFGVASTLELV